MNLTEGGRMMRNHGWWWVFGPPVMLIVWGAFIALAVWVVRAIWRSGEPRPPSQSSLDIAKNRYAKGEITREEFDQIKKDLGG
jgi:putative membrane protein